MNMRAKVRVSDVKIFTDTTGNTTQENLTFNAVAKSSSYPADGSDENNTFARWTPNATFTLTVNNPVLFGQYVIGDQYYVDFTKAD